MAVELDERTKRIYTLAAETFGDDAKAYHWLHKPLRQLEGRTAAEVIETESGAKQVEIILGRIAHGIAA
jgi:putative toxin-antitoxin system antitoxin component (TIGR02293 family)